MLAQMNSLAVVYLARGAPGWGSSCRRFIESYRRFPADQPHQLYVLCKGFESRLEQERAIRWFAEIDARAIPVADDQLDIGAYLAGAARLGEETLCFLNTHSEIISPGWLAMLARQLRKPGVGMVGATGSFESLSEAFAGFRPFPNPHVRTNCFMLRRELLLGLSEGFVVRDKVDAYRFESGTESLGERIRAKGLEILVVGRNGRGYPMRWWPTSLTFRSGVQENLLVEDNVTREYMASIWDDKQAMVARTWRHYTDAAYALDRRAA